MCVHLAYFLKVSIDLQPCFQFSGPASIVKSPIFHCLLLKTLGITVDLLMVWGHLPVLRETGQQPSGPVLLYPSITCAAH